jgi:hypoxanthine phosphoribosyltransferase/FMN phosphatase YigB (HAD superfamily)
MIRLLILDQDGTIYKNKRLLYKIRENTKKFFCNKLSIKEEDYLEWYSKNKQNFPNIFEALKKFNISVEDYHSGVFDVINPKDYLSNDRGLYNSLKKLNMPIYVVTSSSKNYSNRILKSLCIHPLIKESISLSEKNQDKIKIYNEIIKREKINPRDVCIVGDNWYTDLREAEDKGFKTILVGEKDDKPFFLKSIKELPASINQINYPKIDFFNWDDIEKLISEVEEKIRKSEFYPDLIVGIARDGIIPAKLINDRFPNIDLKVIRCKRYHEGFRSEIPDIQIDGLDDVKSKNILLIDDVEDEGITLRAVKERLLKIGASDIKCAILYSGAKKSNADFIGFRGKNFAIFPWNKLQELTEFLKLELNSSTQKEKLKILTKIGFSRKDVLYCMKRLTKGF